MVAIVCTLLSGIDILILVKFREVRPMLPKLDGFLSPKKNFYSDVTIKRMEIDCLKLLDYNLQVNTAHDCLEIIKMGGTFHSDPDLFFKKCEDLLYAFMLDRRSLDFSPMEIACAIVKIISEELCDMKTGYFISKFYCEDFKNAYFVIKRFDILI